MSYVQVKLQDGFWAPRQQVVREVIAVGERHIDENGGLGPYRAAIGRSWPNGKATKFLKAMAAVMGLQRDAAIEGWPRPGARRGVRRRTGMGIRRCPAQRSARIAGQTHEAIGICGVWKMPNRCVLGR